MLIVFTVYSCWLLHMKSLLGKFIFCKNFSGHGLGFVLSQSHSLVTKLGVYLCFTKVMIYNLCYWKEVVLNGHRGDKTCHGFINIVIQPTELTSHRQSDRMTSFPLYIVSYSVFSHLHSYSISKYICIYASKDFQIIRKLTVKLYYT